MLRLIRRTPRVLHALLVLALSTICVTIISVWVVLWCWPTSPGGNRQYFLRGIGDEIGRVHLAEYGAGWMAAVNLFERVTIDTSSGIRVGFAGSRHWDIASFRISIPVDTPRWRPKFIWFRSGFSLGLISHDGYSLSNGCFGNNENNIAIQKIRTGLTEQEVMRIAQLPRLSFSIALPLFVWIILTGWYPLFLVVRGPLRRRRRARRGWCIKCGYDLTGNESGVCPECGKPVAPKNRSANRG